MIPQTVEQPYILFNGNSGYTWHGDHVSLFADRIDNTADSGASSSDLALQLWACQAPYHGGPLSGWKLAELPLGPLQANHYLAPVDSDTRASFPAAGDYAIALVIAEWDGTGFNRIHDYHNYPNRDLVLHPRFDGPVGYRCMETGRMVAEAKRIHNPRAPDNISGTLALELWALPEAYASGAFTGHALAAVTLGSLAGGASWQDCAYELELTPPPAGTYTLTLMLREWNGDGYVTRDHVNFASPVTFPLVPAPPASNTATAAASLDESPVAAPILQPAEAATVAGPGGTADEQRSAPQPPAQPRAAPPSQSARGHSRLAGLMAGARRLFELLKKYW